MSETYIGTTERAAMIRAELKKRYAWTGRDVSVKADHFSMGSAIRISIKKADIPLAAVKEIAAEHESISRDEATGEILSGGNRYLEVGYSQEARAVIAARHLPALEAAAEKLAAGDPAFLLPVEGSDFLLGYGRHGKAYGFTLWKQSGGLDAEVCDLREAAIVVGMGGRRQS
jgi:hypothetical protein